jgi:hypothetical protein
MVASRGFLVAVATVQESNPDCSGHGDRRGRVYRSMVQRRQPTELHGHQSDAGGGITAEARSGWVDGDADVDLHRPVAIGARRVAAAEATADDLPLFLREVELSAFVGRRLAASSRLEVLWRIETKRPEPEDDCAVEWDGDDEHYDGKIIEVGTDGRVKVRYAQDGKELWEATQSLLSHNDYQWLPATLQWDVGTWQLHYNDGDIFPVQGFRV